MFDEFDDHDEPAEPLSPRAKEILFSVLEHHLHLDPHRDHDLLVTYCAAVDRHERASAAANQLTSFTVPSTKGTQMMAPELRIVRDEANAIRQLAIALQIAPSARSQFEEREDEPNAIEQLALAKSKLTSVPQPA